MILCDLCGTEKQCSEKEIEGRLYDICSDCWNPLAEKLKGKGREKAKDRKDVFLPPLTTEPEPPPKTTPHPGKPPKIWGHAGRPQ